MDREEHPDLDVTIDLCDYFISSAKLMKVSPMVCAAAFVGGFFNLCEENDIPIEDVEEMFNSFKDDYIQIMKSQN